MTVYRALGELMQRIDDTAGKVRASNEAQERSRQRAAEAKDRAEGGPLRRHLERMREAHRVELSVEAYGRRRARK